MVIMGVSFMGEQTLAINALIGGVLSLLLSYFPNLSERFEDLTGNQKLLLMGVLTTLVSILITALGCLSECSTLACEGLSFNNIFNTMWEVFVGTQLAYIATPTKQNKDNE